MIKKTAFHLVVTLCFFAILATVNAISHPVAAQTCDTVTDAAIVSAIVGKIKADKRLAAQIKHINVVSVSKAVKLQGWVETQKDFDRVVSFATGTSCVRLVNVNDFEPKPPATNLKMGAGCAAGMKACGDICIPEADACNDSP